MSHTAEIQPVFDPQNVGASLDEINAQIAVNAPWISGSVIGETASRRKGEGFDLDGIRDYVLGDDTRGIDWMATARHPQHWPQIREHYQDVTPNMWIVTDMAQSRNNTIEGGHFSEQLLAMSAVMSLMRIAQLQNMPSAVLASHDRGIAIRQTIPTQGRAHILSTAKQLAANVTREKTASGSDKYRLADLLRFAGQHCTESVVAIVSDFRDAGADDPERGWRKPLERLAHQGNTLIAVETTNPWDFELPKQVDRFKTNDSVIWVGNNRRGKAARKRYVRDADLQQETINDANDAARAYHVTLSTAEGRWRDSLRNQLRTRR